MEDRKPPWLSEGDKLEQLLTSKETAKLLQVGQKSLIALGLPYIQIGNKRRYDPADIRSWLKRYRIDPDAVRESLPTARERARIRRDESSLSKIKPLSQLRAEARAARTPKAK